MDDFEYLAIDTGRGMMRSVGKGRFLASTALLADPALGAGVAALDSGIDNMAREYQAGFADRSDSGRQKLAIEAAQRHVAQSFRALQSAIPKAVAGHAAHIAEVTAPPKQASTDSEAVRAVREASRFAEDRAFAASLPMGKRFEAALADPALAAAIVDGGQLRSGLPVEMFHSVQREVALANLGARLADQHGYTVPPTPDNPVGGEPDRAAARKAAETALAALEARRDVLDSAPALLAQAVTVVAMLTEGTRENALELLGARAR